MNKKVKTQVIIQARAGSSRLPGKILMPFVDNISVLGWIIERAKCSKSAERIVVATTVNSKDDETVKVCERHCCSYYRGSEEDVLDRFLNALKAFPCDVIMHITADNPFFDVTETDRLASNLEENGLDYTSNHPMGMPLGTGTEAFTSESFFAMADKTNDLYDHEHVTPYYYNHPELFKLLDLAPLETHPFAKNVRLTLDTPEDFKFLRSLNNVMNITDPKEQPSTNEILTFLEAHPKLVEINRGIVQKTFPSRNYKNH